MSECGERMDYNGEGILPGPSLNMQSHHSFEDSTNNASPSYTAIKVGGNMNVGGAINFKFVTNVSEHKLNPVVTTFQLIDNPISKFTGRENLLLQIHDCFKKCSLATGLNDRIVVIDGIGGIGKSEAARQYAAKYIKDSIIQNVAWIDSESKRSLKASFVFLAKTLKLEIPIDEDKMNAEQIVKDVYKHFSDRVHNGLFIFDNSLQMETSDNYFGISKYLPTQLGFKKRPLILITARTSDWDIPNENIIKIEELSQEESVELLKKKLNLTPPQLEDNFVLNAISKLASALRGYPPGLTLAASSIDSEDCNDLCKQIDNYLKRMEMPAQQIKWTDDKYSDGDLNNNYLLIMTSVWEATFEKIISKGEIGIETMQLLKIMAYMPPDEIKIDEVKKIFVFIFSEEIVQKCFSILSKFSLISIHKEKYEWGSTFFRIRIHRLLQHFTRIQQEEEKDDTIVIQYCMYLSQQITTNYIHLPGIFLYLKNYWPANTCLIQFAILFCSGRVRFEKKQLRNRLQILFKYFQDHENNHFMLEKEKLEGNQVQLIMLSLYFYQFFLEEFLGDNEKLQVCQTTRLETNNFAKGIFKSYFEYLLTPSTDSAMKNQDSSKVTQMHVYQMCYEILIQDVFKTSMKELIALLTKLVDPEQRRFGRKETVEILYKLLARYFNKNRECTSLVEMYWNGIVQIHGNVYPTIDLNSEEDMKNYWRRGGPIHNYCEFLSFELTSNVQLFQENTFLLNGVCKILEQGMQFLYVYGDENWDSINSLENIMIIVQILNFPEELISHGLFMKHFYSVVIKFPAMTLYGQIQRFATFIGFFSKNKVLKDKDGCNWSILCVVDQLKDYYGETLMANMDHGIKEMFKGRGEDSKKYIQDFIQLHKNDTDQETEIAVKFATRILKVKDNNIICRRKE